MAFNTNGGGKRHEASKKQFVGQTCSLETSSSSVQNFWLLIVKAA
jgi:hypothetical protein